LLSILSTTDPHFVNFHGAAFDFQSGCDVVLVKTSEIEIHLRLKKMDGWSAIDTFAIQIGSDIFEVNDAGAYYLNGSPNTFTSSTIGSYPLTVQTSGSSATFKIALPDVNGESFFIAVETINIGGGGGGGDDDPSMSPTAVPTTSPSPAGGAGRELKSERILSHENVVYMSFWIQGHGSIFEGSTGLYGDWDAVDNRGLNDRNDAAMNLPYRWPN